MKRGDLPTLQAYAQYAYFQDGAMASRKTMKGLVEKKLVDPPKHTSIHSPYTLHEVVADSTNSTSTPGVLENQQSAKHHECNKQGWATCATCNGRLHLPGCTARKDPSKDCVPERCNRYVRDSVGTKLKTTATRRERS